MGVSIVIGGQYGSEREELKNYFYNNNYVLEEYEKD